MPDPISKSEFVNVVFASDESFLPVTNVAATSVAANYRDTRKLRIFLLVEKALSNDALARYEGLAEKYGFVFYPIVVSAESFSSVRTTRGISIATYFRLFMHLVLPEDVDKAVYLDADMIAVDNIASLFDTDLDGFLFAGSEDYNSNAHRKAYGVPEDSVNVNAGMLVCNVRKMREIGFAEVVQSYVERNRFRIFHGDQQILNALFHDQMTYSDIRWNLHGELMQPGWAKKNIGNRAKIDPQAVDRAARNPGIIHYNGSMKPWVGGSHPKRKDWFYYAEKSSYSDFFTVPSLPEPSKPKPPSLKVKIRKALWLDKLERALVEGYKARTTRMRFDKLFSKGQLWKEKPFENLRVLSEKASILQMHQYLHMRSLELRDKEFSAAAYVRSLPEDTKIYSNAPGFDLEGGFHENVKLIFRSSHISAKVLPYEARLSLVLHMAIRTTGFWDALLTSSFDRDLLFGEAAFFGAYSGYFDTEAPAIARRPFGYILDDICYYYDARQPSRLEMKLNSPSYTLSETEFDRSSKLIDRVVAERLTKYNRYAKRGTPVTLEPNAVVIIDQTPHDASVKFGGAERRTILDMAQAAINENPGSPVYFKRHPDNVKRNRETLSASARVNFLPDDADITDVLDQCTKVYVVASQVGFEAVLRGKHVVTFGMPFYAGWGLTEDRQPFTRRTMKRSRQELFHAACIDMSVYVDPNTGELIEIEDAFDLIQSFRDIDTATQQDYLEEEVLDAQVNNG